MDRNKMYDYLGQHRTIHDLLLKHGLACKFPGIFYKNTRKFAKDMLHILFYLPKICLRNPTLRIVRHYLRRYFRSQSPFPVIKIGKRYQKFFLTTASMEKKKDDRNSFRIQIEKRKEV